MAFIICAGNFPGTSGSRFTFKGFCQRSGSRNLHHFDRQDVGVSASLLLSAPVDDDAHGIRCITCQRPLASRVIKASGIRLFPTISTLPPPFRAARCPFFLRFSAGKSNAGLPQFDGGQVAGIDVNLCCKPYPVVPDLTGCGHG